MVGRRCGSLDGSDPSLWWSERPCQHRRDGVDIREGRLVPLDAARSPATKRQIHGLVHRVREQGNAIRLVSHQLGTRDIGGNRIVAEETIPAKTGDGLKGPSPSPATMPSTSTRCDLWGVSAMDPSGRANLRIRATSRVMRHAVSFPAQAPPMIPCCPMRASRNADFPTILVALPSHVCGAAYDRSEISDASDRSGFPRGCSSPRPCRLSWR